METFRLPKDHTLKKKPKWLIPKKQMVEEKEHGHQVPKFYFGTKEKAEENT